MGSPAIDEKRIHKLDTVDRRFDFWEWLGGVYDEFYS